MTNNNSERRLAHHIVLDPKLVLRASRADLLATQPPPPGVLTTEHSVPRSIAGRPIRLEHVHLARRARRSVTGAPAPGRPPSRCAGFGRPISSISRRSSFRKRIRPAGPFFPSRPAPPRRTPRDSAPDECDAPFRKQKPNINSDSVRGAVGPRVANSTRAGEPTTPRAGTAKAGYGFIYGWRALPKVKSLFIRCSTACAIVGRVPHCVPERTAVNAVVDSSSARSPHCPTGPPTGCRRRRGFSRQPAGTIASRERRFDSRRSKEYRPPTKVRNTYNTAAT